MSNEQDEKLMRDLDILEQKAMAATPGPWRFADRSATFGTMENPERMTTIERNLTHPGHDPCIRRHNDGTSQILSLDEPIEYAANAVHIVANSPDVTLMLVRKLRGLMVEQARAREILEKQEARELERHEALDALRAGRTETVAQAACRARAELDASQARVGELNEALTNSNARWRALEGERQEARDALGAADVETIAQAAMRVRSAARTLANGHAELRYEMEQRSKRVAELEAANLASGPTPAPEVEKELEQVTKDRDDLRTLLDATSADLDDLRSALDASNGDLGVEPQSVTGEWEPSIGDRVVGRRRWRQIGTVTRNQGEPYPWVVDWHNGETVGYLACDLEPAPKVESGPVTEVSPAGRAASQASYPTAMLSPAESPKSADEAEPGEPETLASEHPDEPEREPDEPETSGRKSVQDRVVTFQDGSGFSYTVADGGKLRRLSAELSPAVPVDDHPRSADGKFGPATDHPKTECASCARLTELLTSARSQVDYSQGQVLAKIALVDVVTDALTRTDSEVAYTQRKLLAVREHRDSLRRQREELEAALRTIRAATRHADPSIAKPIADEMIRLGLESPE